MLTENLTLIMSCLETAWPGLKLRRQQQHKKNNRFNEAEQNKHLKSTGMLKISPLLLGVSVIKKKQRVIISPPYSVYKAFVYSTQYM